MTIRSDSGKRNTFNVLPGVVAAVLVAGCGGGGPPGGPPPTAVSVARVVERSITEWDEFTGRIEAVESVALQPRVSGYIDKIHFTEGAVVAEGDLLVSIDDREFRANVAAQRADVVRAETRLELAVKESARAEKLVAAKAISAEEFDQRTGEARQAEADLDGPPKQRCAGPNSTLSSRVLRRQLPGASAKR